jgi:hypothetical protein
MAAPHVAGLIGLILTKYPTLSLKDLRWRILNGTDALEGLTGKVATGGRINANNSLRLPMAPRDLSALQVSETEIELNWVDTSVDEEGFTIERREKNGGFQEIARVEPNTTRYSDTDLAGESPYTYRVKAHNHYGNSGYSNEATAAHSGGGSNLAGGSSGGGCFIATAAYGSPLAEEVWILRKLRDTYLLKNICGKTIVFLYYKHSPALAHHISRHHMARKAIRICLYPLVTLSKWLLDSRN